MVAYIVRRLAQALVVLAAMSVAVFLIIHLTPGDPAYMVAGPWATPAQVEVIRNQLGLNEPLPNQYVLWLSRVVRGDLGKSFINQAPVGELILRRVPVTFQLAMGGLAVALLLSFPLGFLAALRKQARVEVAVSTFSALSLAIPNFWLGLLLALGFGLWLRWVPPSGYISAADDPVQSLRLLVLPAVTLGIPVSAVLTRFIKSSLTEVMNNDYIRTARAKGLAETTIVRRHGIKNAMIPVVTVIGVQMGHLLGGAVIVESIFDWPGLGKLVLYSVTNRDYAVVQGCILFIVLVFAAINLLTDVAYAYLDPRIRLTGGRKV
ncbi:MAG: ABC transporter permease [Chloroflexi bacterium]|nr:ABC transporter permease [Chloroflexota bacterium]MCL5107993.1 ABC transporter permease [Chloroflexota bacterium]